MEFSPFDGQGGKLLLGHLDARSVGVRIQLGSNMETRIGRRAADQIDYHFKAEQRTTAPVMGDMQNIRCSILFHLLVPGGK